MKKLFLRLNSIRESLPRVLRIGAEHLLVSFILLFILALMITGAVWYRSIRLESITSGDTAILFRKGMLFEIIDTQEKRAKAVESLFSKEYKDVFFSEE